MRYKTRDGVPFHGSTPWKAATALRATSRDPRDSLQAWIEATAKSAEQQTGKTVRTASCRVFLIDLEQAGLIE